MPHSTNVLPRLAPVVFVCWACVVFAMTATVDVSRGISFGPSPSTFLGVPLDRWDKVCALYVVGLATGCTDAYCRHVLYPWLNHNVNDDSSVYLEDGIGWVYVTALLTPTMHRASVCLGIAVVMTLQLQYVAPQLVGELLVTAPLAMAALRHKRGFGVDANEDVRSRMT